MLVTEASLKMLEIDASHQRATNCFYLQIQEEENNKTAR